MSSMNDVTQPRLSGTVKVGNGRRLGYAEFGVPGGIPLVWLHGTPGARTQVPHDARELALREGLRIIGIDRPGIGASTAHVYTSIAEFTGDLIQVFDALGVERAGVIGLSGGGPYALAAGALLGDRVGVVASLGGVAPTKGEDAISGGLVALGGFVGPLIRFGRIPLGVGLSRFVQLTTPVGGPILDLYARFSPPGDRELLHRPEFKAMFLRDLTRGGRRQFSAPFADLMLFTRHWGFELCDVNVPVHWWHGDSDNIVPMNHGEHVVARLPNATFHPSVGGGHLSGFGKAEEVLETLMNDLA